MKNRLPLLLLFFAHIAIAQQWQPALPGYQYHFPRDYFDHPGYQTEWWYYTGNLRAQDGRRYGFELTFFREGVRLPPHAAASEDKTWLPNEIYLAHLALSDIDGKSFYHTQRLNRAGPGLAGASLAEQRYWNGNWQVRWTSLPGTAQHLQAVCDRLTLELDLTPEKPAIINGQNGVSQKGPQPGQASHYLSFTRIRATGTLKSNSHVEPVNGLAWMDHEYFSEQLNRDLAGWDWFAIQLDNHEELMLYRLRKKSGGEDPYSSGTFVDDSGKSHFLGASDFSLMPGEVWRSSHSGASYPVSWIISVPSLQLQLSEQTALDDQELFSGDSISPSYWEGAVTYSGQRAGRAVKGMGYLEMTGYGQPLRFGD
jgi:predicted secreted hydrolase